MQDSSDRKRRSTQNSRRHSQFASWRRPAERTVDKTSDHPVWLTASELGSFAFCPQSWYLDRHRVNVTNEAEVRREVGRHAHREIGRQTDLIRVADVGRRLLVLAIFATLLLLATLVLRSIG